MHLYEAHLPVADTEAAKRFYVEIVGLQFAHRDVTRDAIFLWAGADRRSMLGLWGPSTTLGGEFHKKMASRVTRSEEHTSELQSRFDLVCRLLLEKKKKKNK